MECETYSLRVSYSNTGTKSKDISEIRKHFEMLCQQENHSGIFVADNPVCCTYSSFSECGLEWGNLSGNDVDQLEKKLKCYFATLQKIRGTNPQLANIKTTISSQSLRKIKF